MPLYLGAGWDLWSASEHGGRSLAEAKAGAALGGFTAGAIDSRPDLAERVEEEAGTDLSAEAERARRRAERLAQETAGKTSAKAHLREEHTPNLGRVLRQALHRCGLRLLPAASALRSAAELPGRPREH